MKILVKFVLCLVICMAINISETYASGVFDIVKSRTTAFARDLRVLAYVISCFGIVMFTFLAISGKINFKHLGYIFISLSMLSATGGIIDYFSGSHARLAFSFNDTAAKSLSSMQSGGN